MGGAVAAAPQHNRARLSQVTAKALQPAPSARPPAPASTARNPHTVAFDGHLRDEALTGRHATSRAIVPTPNKLERQIGQNHRESRNGRMR